MNVTLRTRKLKDTERYYLDITDRGYRKMEKLDFYLYRTDKGRRLNSVEKEHNARSQEMAERVAMEKRLTWQAEGYGISDIASRNANFLEFCLSHIKTSDYAEKTVTLWYSSMSMFESFVDTDYVPFKDLCEDFILEYKLYLDKQDISSSTRNKYFGHLLQLIKKAYDYGKIYKNYANRVKNYKCTHKRKDHLTYEELCKIVKGVNLLEDDEKRAFVFSCYTGIRAVDVKQIRWKDIKPIKDCYYINFLQEKTKSDCTGILSKETYDLLGTPGDGDELVFPKFKNRQYYITNWVKDNGIDKHITYHSSRNTFATLVQRENRNIYTTQKLLGHKSIQSTQIYTRVDPSDLIDKVKLIPNLK